MSRWKGIILHHSAARDRVYVDTERYRQHHLARGWRDIGYHYVVELIDTHYYALMGRPTTMDGAHCPTKNEDHLGICFAGNFMEQQMPENMIRVGADLIASLCVMNDIEISAISLHKNWRMTDCPGSEFPLQRIIAEVKKRLEE